MFLLSEFELPEFKYLPILSISPSEMNALEELPDKDKNALLPLFPLSGWVSSKSLENSLQRIHKSIGDRKWIGDIDRAFLEDCAEFIRTGKYPREVYYQVEALLDPSNGYENWFRFTESNENIIPVVQLDTDLERLRTQLVKLNSLQRGIVFRFRPQHIESGYYVEVLRLVADLSISNVCVIIDLEKVDSKVLELATVVAEVINRCSEFLGRAIFAISGSSFPDSFGGYCESENTIYERLLFNSVKKICCKTCLIFSDRGSARAFKSSGGAGLPAPRIDFPLANDWKFIRKEFADPKSPEKGEKERLYTLIAKEIMKTEYWNPDLYLWGTQVIDITSRGDKFGINSPQKSTAVRINIHMHQQLCYDEPSELLDTDEDWED